MRNNESIRASPVYKSRLLLFSSDAISSVPSLCVTSRDDGKKSALLLNEMKRRKSWKKGKWRMERRKTPEESTGYRIFSQCITPDSHSLSLSLCLFHPLVHSLAVSLCFTLARRPFRWILYLWHEWKRG